LTPYIRYDYSDDSGGSAFGDFPSARYFDGRLNTTAITTGISFRPIYEVLIKAEYRFLDNNVIYENVNIPGPFQTKMPPENPLNITTDKYNHFILSLVYSF